MKKPSLATIASHAEEGLSVNQIARLYKTTDMALRYYITKDSELDIKLKANGKIRQLKGKRT